MAEACRPVAETRCSDRQEPDVWDAGPVWMGHLHGLSQSEQEYGDAQESQTGLIRFEKS